MKCGQKFKMRSINSNKIILNSLLEHEIHSAESYLHPLQQNGRCMQISQRWIPHRNRQNDESTGKSVPMCGKAERKLEVKFNSFFYLIKSALHKGALVPIVRGHCQFHHGDGTGQIRCVFVLSDQL